VIFNPVQNAGDLYARQPSGPPTEQASADFEAVFRQRERSYRASGTAPTRELHRAQHDARARAASSDAQTRQTERDDAQQRSVKADDRREQQRIEDRQRQLHEDDQRDDIVDDRHAVAQRDDVNDTPAGADEAGAQAAVADGNEASGNGEATAMVADKSAESADTATVVTRVEVRPATQAANEAAIADATVAAEAQASGSSSQQSNQSNGNSQQASQPVPTVLENTQKSSTDSQFKLGTQSVAQADVSAATPAALPAGGRIEVQSAQPVAQAAPPAPLPQADSDGVLARVARGLHNAVQQNGGTVTMRLNPPELGVLRIELEMNNGTASVRFQTGHSNVRELLNQQLHTLRQGLEGHGVSVERLDVQISSSAARENSFNQQGDDGRSRGQFTQQGNRQGGGSQDDGSSRRQAARSFLDEFNAVA
jgi:flagellar hook-length control protein FliK